MLALAGAPSVIMFVGMLFMPETPRWLIYHKKPQKAKRSLAKVLKKDAVDEIFQTIVEDYEEYCKTKMSKTLKLNTSSISVTILTFAISKVKKLLIFRIFVQQC